MQILCIFYEPVSLFYVPLCFIATVAGIAAVIKGVHVINLQVVLAVMSSRGDTI